MPRHLLRQALERQRRIEKARDLAWALFVLFALTALSSTVALIIHLAVAGLSSPVHFAVLFLLALFSILATIGFLRSGLRLNRRLKAPALNARAEPASADGLWSIFLPFWWD